MQVLFSLLVGCDTGTGNDGCEGDIIDDQTTFPTVTVVMFLVVWVMLTLVAHLPYIPCVNMMRLNP